MKKFLIMAMAGLFIAGISSCKADYECCVVFDGEKSDLCETKTDLSKSDVKDLEDASENLGGVVATTECEKK